MTKKLAWFNTDLLTTHGIKEFNQERGLNPYLMQVTEATWPDVEKTQWHQSILKVLPYNICFVDQTELSKQYGDGLDLARLNVPLVPNLDNGAMIEKEFNGAACKRVEEMYAQAESNNIHDIRIAWSGGTDSNFILSAVMQHPLTESWKDRITILTTRYAKREDPEIWNWVMSSGLKIDMLNYDTLMCDQSNWMLVTGEGDMYGTMFPDAHKKYTDSHEQMYWDDWHSMEKFFTENDPFDISWDYFKALMQLSPIPIETSYHAWWWFESNLTEQCFLFRSNAYSTVTDIRQDRVFPGKSLFGFLANQDFLDHGFYCAVNRLIKTDPAQMKHHLLQHVANWQGWQCIHPKLKFFSQGLVPKRIHKWRIYDDMSWDRGTNLLEW